MSDPFRFARSRSYRRRFWNGKRMVDLDAPRYSGPTWIGKPITPPPIEVGPGWIGKRIPYRREQL